MHVCRGQRIVFHNFKTSNKESTSNQAQTVLNKGLKEKKKKKAVTVAFDGSVFLMSLQHAWIFSSVSLVPVTKKCYKS